MLMPVIQHLFIYPVKSMKGVPCGQARLMVSGLEYDRNWMVTDGNGGFKTQRDLPGLAMIEPDILENMLVLKNKRGREIHIPVDKKGDCVTVDVWGDSCKAIDQGDRVAEWLKNSLGLSSSADLRLVRFDESCKRPVDTEYLKGEESYTAFADGFPFLVTSMESLHRLNDQLISSGCSAIPMNRFRPNIVIKGVQPFQEDHSHTLRHKGGMYQLGIRKACKRCVITTRDQVTTEVHEPGEPLRTLVAMKTIPDKNGAYFGQNATLIKGKDHIIRVGDSVQLE